MKKNNKRLVNRYFTVILYEEDPKEKEIFKKIIDKYTEVTWIKHNKDITEERRKEKRSFTCYI